MHCCLSLQGFQINFKFVQDQIFQVLLQLQVCVYAYCMIVKLHVQYTDNPETITIYYKEKTTPYPYN